jgi:crotonobetainyl-CoA:carnitine CoA-transferase CaiB-like acyl-CoA transferase
MTAERNSDQSKGPLVGIRVIDLTQFLLGPYATQMLGDLGADVIKIEEPSGDRQRMVGKAPVSKNMGSTFLNFNRNKRSVVLDLKSEDGKRALRKLILTGDIFIHNMRPKSVAALGFAYADVAAIKPDIVYVEAMGFDAAGPYAGRQAFDDLIQAASGACGLDQLVDESREFRPLPGMFADKTCGLFAVIAALAALRHKEHTGEGQFVAVPMLETFTGHLLADHLYGETYIPPTGKIGYTFAVSPERKPLPTKDGFIMLLPANREQSVRFFELGGMPGAYESERFTSLTTSPQRVAEYNAMLREAALAHSTEEWTNLAAEHSIPLMRANRLDELFDDKQLKQTLFEERGIEGEGKYRAMKPGLRFAQTPSAIWRDPPKLGEHTGEILAEIGE